MTVAFDDFPDELIDEYERIEKTIEEELSDTPNTGEATERKELEFACRDITVAGFIALVREKCKEAGLGLGFDIDDFENPPWQEYSHTTSYFRDDNGNRVQRRTNLIHGETVTTKVEQGTWVRCVEHSKPLEHEFYSLLENGKCFHEICRFKHDKESSTLGKGYYYQLDIGPKAAPTEAPTTEESAENKETPLPTATLEPVKRADTGRPLKKTELEFACSDKTLREFLKMVRELREDNGIEDESGFDLDRWERPTEDEIHSYTVSYYKDKWGKDMVRRTDLMLNETTVSPGTSYHLVRELSRREPMDAEFYTQYDDGTCFHEILRFKFDEDSNRFGSGYYYLFQLSEPMDESNGIAFIHFPPQTQALDSKGV